MDEISAVCSCTNGRQLTPEEQVELAKMVARDREVRAHEAAHLAAAGALANGVEYDYEMGPDGRLYAVGGKVNVTVSSSGTPEEALAKAQQLRAAASAPADPSGQDLSVIAKASALEADATRRIAKERETGDSPATVPFGRFERTA